MRAIDNTPTADSNDLVDADPYDDGSCEECHDGTPAHPGSYTLPAASTQAA